MKGFRGIKKQQHTETWILYFYWWNLSHPIFQCEVLYYRKFLYFSNYIMYLSKILSYTYRYIILWDFHVVENNGVCSNQLPENIKYFISVNILHKITPSAWRRQNSDTVKEVCLRETLTISSSAIPRLPCHACPAQGFAVTKERWRKITGNIKEKC